MPPEPLTFPQPPPAPFPPPVPGTRPDALWPVPLPRRHRHRHRRRRSSCCLRAPPLAAAGSADRVPAAIPGRGAARPAESLAAATTTTTGGDRAGVPAERGVSPVAAVPAVVVPVTAVAVVQRVTRAAGDRACPARVPAAAAAAAAVAVGERAAALPAATAATAGDGDGGDTEAVGVQCRRDGEVRAVLGAVLAVGGLAFGAVVGAAAGDPGNVGLAGRARAAVVVGGVGADPVPPAPPRPPLGSLPP